MYEKCPKKEVATGNNRMDKILDCKFGYFASISGFDIHCTLRTEKKSILNMFHPHNI